MDNKLKDIALHFNIKGTPNYIDKYGNGHINRTYLLKTESNDYILQQINSTAFKDVDLLMNNIVIIHCFKFMISYKNPSFIFRLNSITAVRKCQFSVFPDF